MGLLSSMSPPHNPPNPPNQPNPNQQTVQGGSQTQSEKIQPMFMPPQNPPPLPDQDFFKYRIDTNDIIESIEHQLKGEVLTTNKDGEQFYVTKFDRWVNDEGINKILHVIYSNGLNKNVFLGNLTHDEIMYKMKSLKKKIALLLFQKYNDFEIKREMRSLVVSTIINQVHSGLSRCEGGREADQLSTATTRLESYAHNEKERQGGIMSHLPGFRNK